MNKSQLKARCKSILHSYKVGEVINEDDFNSLIPIFRLNSDWERLKGDDVVLIRIASVNDTVEVKCFRFYRMDKSFFYMGYERTIDDYKRNKRVEI